MAEVKILSKQSEAPKGDYVLVTQRLASNNSVVTDIFGVKADVAVKTITERQLTPDAAIEKAQEIADDNEIDIIYVLDAL
jgi:hypothetical protein